ncbi:S8 family serine peptidase [Urechidicola croceus]|uniref:Peptidase S8/S53 domain-containing protein n=1 Tax=Urechidicola croceus TaxID=1850246 RepID=A0A1D8P3M0_9FLAO|nr:S8 family serine peptidase [Urechidicola croceus]AOW19179.1 hypothetical protein LPB138_00075 [Urechidicola croceus]
MKTKEIINQAKPNRYVVLLGNDSQSSVNKVQKELNIKLTSSQELSSEVRAHDIMSSGNGIIFKNLGIAVVDNIEKAQLSKALVTAQNPIVYFEKEIEFRPVDEFQQLQELKNTAAQLQQQLEKLELFLKQKPNEPISDWANATWGINAIGLESSHFTGKGVDICILDTGFYANHPDFNGRNIIGKSFIQGESWDNDGNGHGTHCTGTAAGNISKVDGTRYGVANEANIVIGKVLSDMGSGSTSGIVDAIDWAIEKKYKVISMSLGSPVGIGQEPSPIFEHIGRKALEQNSLLIAAAGNDSNRPNLPRPVSSPANAESIMAIAAIDKHLKVANFSNGGINVSNGGRIDVSAPGVDILSSYSENAPNGKLYARLNGTSMATPHIAGIAALYWEAYPNLTAAELWLKIEKRAFQLQNQLARDVGQGLGNATVN